MKALTVQQPWAWAIVHGGKEIENRTQAWSYRGPLAIHAGQRWSDRGGYSPLVQEAMRRTGTVTAASPAGAIIGVVDLVDVHVAQPEWLGDNGIGSAACCASPWAETSYEEHGGATRRDIFHLELTNPRLLDDPIPCKGRLGLWTPSADVLEQLQAVAS